MSLENILETDIVIEKECRDGKHLTVAFSSDENMLKHVGLEALCGYYRSQLIAHKAMGMFDKKGETSAVLELDWRGDACPIVGKSVRSGAPTALDTARAEKAWGLAEDKLTELLEKWNTTFPHSCTLDSLNNENDPEATLAQLARNVRLAAERATKALF